MTTVAMVANENGLPVICGEVVVAGCDPFLAILAAAVAGMAAGAVVLQLGMDANDMKLLSAVVVALALRIPAVWEKHRFKHSYKKPMLT